jgi:HAD superfamily hydrolase (TIGR01549 family)
MANSETPLRGVIFDYGNTLIWLGPGRRSSRTDYADVVARPGAERLARFLVTQGVLDGGGAAGDFLERWLTLRERNRAEAEKTGKEITASESLIATLEAGGAAAPSDEIVRMAVAESFGPEIEAIEALPDAGETLEMLRKRGVKIALLSNCTDGAYVATVVRRLGWDGYFDPFVVSADIGVRKPLPGAFRPVLDRWSIAPGEIAMVGDSLYHDVAGAERMGIQAIHFTAIDNPGDPAHRAAIHPRWSASSHEELQRLFVTLTPGPGGA